MLGAEVCRAPMRIYNMQCITDFGAFVVSNVGRKWRFATLERREESYERVVRIGPGEIVAARRYSRHFDIVDR
jgi:hypothetical protein